MSTHDAQQVCLNGHQITDSYYRYAQFRKRHCDICGSETIHKCRNCQHDIKGDYHSDFVLSSSATPVPSNCENCGMKFPWAEKKIQAAQHILKEFETDTLDLLQRVCSRFHLVAKQLKTRHSNRGTIDINDEYDTQDLLHALLKIFFDDIRPEEWSPSYAGGGSRVDFLLKDEKTIVEVKKTRKTLKERQLGEELIIDIQKYRHHPDCKKLVCFVYDPEELIANPRGLENDLNKNEGDFTVKVIIVPKGH